MIGKWFMSGMHGKNNGSSLFVGFVSQLQEFDIFGVNNAHFTYRIFFVAVKFNYIATNINRRDAEFAETRYLFISIPSI